MKQNIKNYGIKIEEVKLPKHYQIILKSELLNYLETAVNMVNATVQNKVYKYIEKDSDKTDVLFSK